MEVPKGMQKIVNLPAGNEAAISLLFQNLLAEQFKAIMVIRNPNASYQIYLDTTRVPRERPDGTVPDFSSRGNQECPHCGETFKSVARHIAWKHPEHANGHRDDDDPTSDPITSTQPGGPS